MPAIGVDIGGSKVAAGLLSDDGRLLGLAETALPTREYDGLLDVIAAEVTRLSALAPGDHPVPVGLAMAAWLSPDRERVLAAANLGWAERPLRADVAARTGRPTTVHNDGTSAAWGEHLQGLGDDPPAPETSVLLALGTDVGGGLVVGGRLVTGAHALAGELGHLRVRPDGPACVCGSRGCLSVYASGQAMLRHARSLVGSADAGQLTELCGGVAERLTGADLGRAAAAGDAAAGRVLAGAAEAIAAASAQISRVVDHGLLVLGGGASSLGPPLVEAVADAVGRTDPVGPVRPLPTVRLARAGRAAGVIGAADLAREGRP